MHPLFIQEILHNVVCHARAQASGDHSLAMLARTCRSVSDVSLDALWETQRDLGNLVKCLPADAWTEVPMAEMARRLNLTRALTFSDWTRFDTYARRVKTVGIYAMDEEETEILYHVLLGDVIAALDVHNGPFGLLPNLSFLFAELNGPDVSVHRLLLSSKLKEVVFFDRTNRWGWREEGPLDVAAYLPHLSPKIQTLHAFCSVSPERTLAFYATIKQLRHLRKLSLPFPASDIQRKDMLHLLSALPKLESFHVASALPGGSGPYDMSAHAPPRLPRLKSLRISVEHLMLASALLHAMRETPLEEIEVLSLQRENSDELPLARFFNELTDVPRRTALKIFHFDLTSSLSDDGDDAELSQLTFEMSYIRPLLRFRNLEDVRIDLPFSFDLTNESLAQLAKAWPALKKLQLGRSYGWGNSSAVTLEGLISLAKHCKRLGDVTMPISTDVFNPAVLVDLKPGDENESLRHWCVGNAPGPKDPQAVASFFKKLFPRFCMFHTGYDISEMESGLEDNAVQDTWNVLNDLLA